MTGRLQKKNDFYYAVIQMKDSNGQRKQKWVATGLHVNGNKARATEELRKILEQYENGGLLFNHKTPLLDVLEHWL